MLQIRAFHSQSNVVVIPALVKSAKGEIVYGLAAKDFVVTDDGVEQAARVTGICLPADNIFILAKALKNYSTS